MGFEHDSAFGQDCMFGGLDFNKLDVADITSSSDEESDSEETGPQASGYDPTRVDELLQFQDELPCATEDDFDELFAWVQRQGADLKGIRYDRDNHCGRTLYASRKVSEGGLLATLPRSLRFGQAYACRELDLPLDTPDLSALTLLVLSLCKDEHIYARCLPRKSEFTNALLMTKQEQFEWEDRMGSEYADAFRAMQSRGKSCGLYIRDYLSSVSVHSDIDAIEPMVNNEFDTATLYWAMSMVKSRSHAFGSKRGFWLTPIFDLVNHSPAPNARLEGDSSGYLVMKALRDIQSNEEITIDYQVKDDPMLVATYGFSLKAGA
uniref:SET domain-containing protein n=1 Tax=Odontella aurita TaxID=265563 RepID=A0A7S4MSI5_9STRA|mmetsp:Transcript_3068/g.7989  ORF Transcript_3068/g.7989 Transcript_3068/m.7989 type:complete len:321 (+) Transcript_3068:91-1053(+)